MTSARDNVVSLLEGDLNGAEILVVDVETTGLSPDTGDRVCEIGAVKLRGSAIVDTFGSLVNPGRPVSAGAYAVNQISSEMLRDAPVFEEVTERLETLMEGSILAAYNAPFDMAFLTSEFRLAGRKIASNPVVDVLPLARRLLPGLGKYPQANVARVIGIPARVKHRALDDALITTQIFLMFSSMLKAYGCSSCSDLIRTDVGRLLHDRRLTIIREAMTNHSGLWMRYLSPVDGEITQRIVSPLEYVPAAGSGGTGGFLIAHCREVGRQQSFHIDRILDLRSLKDSAG